MCFQKKKRISQKKFNFRTNWKFLFLQIIKNMRFSTSIFSTLYFENQGISNIVMGLFSPAPSIRERCSYLFNKISYVFRISIKMLNSMSLVSIFEFLIFLLNFKWLNYLKIGNTQNELKLCFQDVLNLENLKQPTLRKFSDFLIFLASLSGPDLCFWNKQNLFFQINCFVRMSWLFGSL